MNKLQVTLTKKEDFVLMTMLKRIEDFEKSSRAMQKATYQITLKNKEMMIDLEKKVQKLVVQENVKSLAQKGFTSERVFANLAEKSKNNQLNTSSSPSKNYFS